MNRTLHSLFSATVFCGLILSLSFVLPACSSDDSNSDDELDRNINMNTGGGTGSEANCRNGCVCACGVLVPGEDEYDEDGNLLPNIEWVDFSAGPTKTTVDEEGKKVPRKSTCVCQPNKGCQPKCVDGLGCEDDGFGVDIEVDDCSKTDSAAVQNPGAHSQQ